MVNIETTYSFNNSIIKHIEIYGIQKKCGLNFYAINYNGNFNISSTYYHNTLETPDKFIKLLHDNIQELIQEIKK